MVAKPTLSVVPLVLLLLSSSRVAGSSSQLRRRLNPPCATLEGCYLWDITTKGAAKKLSGNDYFCPTDSPQGWSVRCDGDYTDNSTLDEIKFFYDGKVQDEYGEPRFMNGDANDGDWVNKVDYLSQDPTTPKTLQVEGRQWARSCFNELYTLTPSCGCNADYQCPTNWARKQGLSCYRDINDCECAEGFAMKDGQCLARPPQPATCYLWPNNALFYGYNAQIPSNTTLEVKTSSGTVLPYITTPGDYELFIANQELYAKEDFMLRFVLPNGISGEYKDCLNYFGRSTFPPLTNKCYLWNQKLSFGALNFVPENYTVETKTDTNLTFSYTSIGFNFVYAKDFRAYNGQPFSLRFIDLEGNKSPWRRCLSYTPIALDLDRSGEVEQITGEFKIDITGDGEAETLEQWFGPKEGILIDTRPGINGGAVTGAHLFGDMGQTYVDGYAKLSLLDKNGDGSVAGGELLGLAIWIDGNSNARLDEGEMSTLENHGIVSLNVHHENFLSKALMADGSTVVMEDKWFQAVAVNILQ